MGCIARKKYYFPHCPQTNTYLKDNELAQNFCDQMAILKKDIFLRSQKLIEWKYVPDHFKKSLTKKKNIYQEFDLEFDATN